VFHLQPSYCTFQPGPGLEEHPELAMKFTASSIRLVSIVLAVFAIFVAPSFSQDVLTYHYNNSHNGLNAAESMLTLSNVNSATFGKLFTLTVDGLVDAEPLYLSTFPVNGANHNVLVVATENDSVYAFDADAGTQLWHVSMLESGETPSDDRGCSQITPEIGVTATPVIRRVSQSSAVIYVVAMSKDSSGNYYQRLHALSATTGKDLKTPVAISAQYPGTGDNSSNGYVIFDPSQYAERGGLLLSNGVIYLAWTSHCDDRPYTGWIMGYNANTLAQQTVIDVTPNGNEGSIWGAGSGLTADSEGNIYFLDANGIFDTTLNSSGFPSEGDYGNAFIKLSTSGGLAVADYFEMYNGPSESDDDIDFGSGGAILLPNMQNSSGATVQLAAGAGKDGNLYLVNRSSLGKFNPNTNKNYQELSGVLPGGCWSMPALGVGSGVDRLYYGPSGSSILAFQFKSAKLIASPVAQTANSFPYPGATPSISSNQGSNVIVWASSNTSPAVLYAYNAINLQQLYNSTQAANGRDNFGNGNKFITPMIINGKVYVGTTTGVGVFGLLSSGSQRSN
jgi:hypothetical protein